MRAVAGGFAGCSQCTQLSVLLVDIMLVLPDSSCSPSFALLVLVLVPVLLLCPGPLHLLVMDDDPTCVDKLTIVDARLLLFLLRAGKRTIPPSRAEIERNQRRGRRPSWFVSLAPRSASNGVV